MAARGAVSFTQCARQVVVSSISVGGMVYFALAAVSEASTLVWGWYLFLSLARLLRITVPEGSVQAGVAPEARRV